VKSIHPYIQPLTQPVRMLSGKKAAVFDLDGTLVDSMWVWNRVDEVFLTKRGIPAPPNLSHDLGPRSFREAAEYFIERFKLNENPIAIQAEWDSIALDFYRHEVSLKPGARALLEHLRPQDIKIGLATSSTPALINAVFDQHGLHEYFTAVRVSNEFEKGKPAPDIFLKVAEDLLGRTGTPPYPTPPTDLFPLQPRHHMEFTAEYCRGLLPLGPLCICFEDHPKAANGAKEGGMFVVGTKDASSPTYWASLEKVADVSVSSFEEFTLVGDIPLPPKPIHSCPLASED